MKYKNKIFRIAWKIFFMKYKLCIPHFNLYKGIREGLLCWYVQGLTLKKTTYHKYSNAVIELKIYYVVGCWSYFQPFPGEIIKISQF